MLSTLVKPIVLIAYACFGVFTYVQGLPQRPDVPHAQLALTTLSAVIAELVFMRFSVRGPVFALSVIGATILVAAWNRAWKSPQLLLAGFTVVTAGASLAWWLAPGGQPQKWWQVVAFVLMAGLIEAGLGHMDGEPAS